MLDHKLFLSSNQNSLHLNKVTSMCLQPQSLLSWKCLRMWTIAFFFFFLVKSLCNKTVMKKYRGSRAQIAVFTKNTQQVEDVLLWQT